MPGVSEPSITSDAAPHSAPEAASGAGTTSGRVSRERVQEVIEVIRPAIQADQGDIHLVDVDELSGLVKVELVGACVTCPASTSTLKAGIERILKDRVEGVTEVINVGETLGEFSETAVTL
jgi:Fe-S cluster biogenesis protein NfuA